MLAYLEFPNWNPVILDLSWLSANAALRWYGFTYIISFTFGYFALWYMQKRGYLRIAKDDVVNYMIVGVLGVLWVGAWVRFSSTSSTAPSLAPSPRGIVFSAFLPYGTVA